MKLSSNLKTVLAAGAMLAATLAATGGASAADIRFRCDASGATDISMGAKYILRTPVTATSRKQFSTEFEAGPGSGFAAGNRLIVFVKGVRVGTMTLATIVGGDVVGDLNFDTRPDPLDDELPFPASWPAGVGKGSKVNLMRGTKLVLGCTLN